MTPTNGAAEDISLLWTPIDHDMDMGEGGANVRIADAGDPPGLVMPAAQTAETGVGNDVVSTAADSHSGNNVPEAPVPAASALQPKSLALSPKPSEESPAASLLTATGASGLSGATALAELVSLTVGRRCVAEDTAAPTSVGLHSDKRTRTQIRDCCGSAANPARIASSNSPGQSSSFATAAS